MRKMTYPDEGGKGGEADEESTLAEAVRGKGHGGGKEGGEDVGWNGRKEVSLRKIGKMRR
jgi:hypothetical protein